MENIKSISERKKALIKVISFVVEEDKCLLVRKLIKMTNNGCIKAYFKKN